MTPGNSNVSLKYCLPRMIDFSWVDLSWSPNADSHWSPTGRISPSHCSSAVTCKYTKETAHQVKIEWESNIFGNICMSDHLHTCCFNGFPWLIALACLTLTFKETISRYHVIAYADLNWWTAYAMGIIMILHTVFPIFTFFFKICLLQWKDKWSVKPLEDQVWFTLVQSLSEIVNRN